MHYSYIQNEAVKPISLLFDRPSPDRLSFRSKPVAYILISFNDLKFSILIDDVFGSKPATYIDDVTFNPYKIQELLLGKTNGPERNILE